MIEGIEPCPECGHPCTYVGSDKGDMRFYSVRVQFFGCRHDMRVQLPLGVYPDEAATYINRAIVNRRGTMDFYFNLEAMSNQKQDLIERHQSACRCKHLLDEHCMLGSVDYLQVRGAPINSECTQCPCPEFRG